MNGKRGEKREREKGDDGWDRSVGLVSFDTNGELDKDKGLRGREREKKV